MISPRPCPIKVTVKAEVLNMNADLPQAKNPERASVGGRLWRVECRGSNHRKYARHRINANAASRLPLQGVDLNLRGV